VSKWLTDWLTQWNRILLENLTASQLVRELLAFYGANPAIVLYPVHTNSVPFKIRFNITLSSTLRVVSSLQALRTRFYMRATCLARVIPLDLIILTIFSKECKLYSSSLRNCLQHLFTSPLLRPDIPPAPCSQMISIYVSPSTWEQVSHTYKRAGIIIVDFM
jgi:hypothetical protein